MFYLLKYLDLIILAIYFLVAIKNPKSFIMVLLACNYFLHFEVKISNFQLFCFISFYQILASITNIQISSSFRKALLLQGVVYFLSAFNELLYIQVNIKTGWPYIMPFLITWLDLYIIKILLTTGGYGRKRISWMPCILVPACPIRLLCLHSHKQVKPGRRGA